MFTTKAVITYVNNSTHSSPLNVRDIERGQIIVPSTWNTADIGFAGSTDEDGTYVPIVDNSASPILRVGHPSTIVPIPSNVLDGRWISIVCYSNGVASGGQTGTINVLLKGTKR